MGPAGFTLAHHLLNDGHTVVGIDGLKIEPLAPALSGVTRDGERVPSSRSATSTTLHEPLDDRVMAGFGGVAEYGITVRWDKNFLKLIRLLLERRDRFALYGGVRFGGTLDARRRVRARLRSRRARARAPASRRCSNLPNGLANGVRTASDFLMALQLTGAAQARLDRQHAGAPAGRRHRRRPDRDRHRDRVARLLPGAGREVPRALRDAGRRAAAQDAVEARVDRRGARDRRGIPRARARDPRRARGGGARRPRARASSSCCSAGAA